MAAKTRPPVPFEITWLPKKAHPNDPPTLQNSNLCTKPARKVKNSSIACLEESQETELASDSQVEDTQVTTYNESQFDELDDSQATVVGSTPTKKHKGNLERHSADVGCIKTNR